MSQYERKTNFVSFGVRNHITPTDDPLIYQEIDRVQGGGYFGPLNAVFKDVVKEIGFFEKTEFEALFVSVIASEPRDMQEHKLTIEANKRYKSLTVHKYFYSPEMLAALQGDFESFYIKQVAEMLMAVCKNYGLDTRPIEQMLKSHGYSVSAAICSTSDVELTEVDEEELYIYAKMSNDGFGTPAEVLLVNRVMDEIECALEEENLGRLDGFETQAPYQGISCMGPDCRAMFERLSAPLQTLPAGSFVELRGRDKTETVKVGKS